MPDNITIHPGASKHMQYYERRQHMQNPPAATANNSGHMVCGAAHQREQQMLLCQTPDAHSTLPHAQYGRVRAVTAPQLPADST